MKLFLTDKVSEINIVNIVQTLLTDFIEEGIKNNTYKLPESLDSVEAIIDYTKEFIDLYFNDFMGSDLVNNDIKNYIVNRLYNCKGGPEIFNIMKDLMSVSKEDAEQLHINTGIDFDVDYQYDFPHLSILNIKDLRTSNISLFEKKLRAMTNVLMFYDDLNLTIKNIYLLIKDSLTEHEFYYLKAYFDHELEYL